MKKHLQHIRQSLSLKLGFGILLLAIPIFIVSLSILFVESRNNIRQEAMERATSVLNTTSQRVISYLSTVETATNANDWLVTEHMQPDTLLAYSRLIVALNANISGCSITTEPDYFPQYGRYFSAYSVREGDSIATVREAEYEYFDMVWYQTPKKLGRACWVDPFDDFNEGTLSAPEMIASYCKPLYNANNRFIGVLSSDLSFAKLSEAVKKERPYPNAYFFMLGKDGHFLIHPDSMRLFKETIFSKADTRYHADIIALGHEMTNGKHGAMKVEIDGSPCIVCYLPLHGTPWSLALVCPDSDILKSYNQLTYIITPLIIIGMLLILLLCNKIVTHAIRPVNNLLEQTQRIAAGQYDERIPHTDNEDAVGRLQNSFATMQESLDRHISDVRQMNAEAEQRNKELTEANWMAEEAGRQKTTFIQNMTHQIRTPLNIIMGFAQVLRDSIKDLPEEEIKSITDMMDHNAMTLNRMVLMLYDSSDSGLTEELQSHKAERVSVNEVARQSISDTLANPASPNYPNYPNQPYPIKFETTLPDTFCILTNRLYLMRSLREILYNSGKYSDGQNISLKVKKTEARILFIFEDTGPGIEESYWEQMYVPFTKINDLSEGLGLGLPLAKRHVQNLGGNLELDTSYHDGCRFIIELPI